MNSTFLVKSWQSFTVCHYFHFLSKYIIRNNNNLMFDKAPVSSKSPFCSASFFITEAIYSSLDGTYWCNQLVIIISSPKSESLLFLLYWICSPSSQTESMHLLLKLNIFPVSFIGNFCVSLHQVFDLNVKRRTLKINKTNRWEVLFSEYINLIVVRRIKHVYIECWWHCRWFGWCRFASKENVCTKKQSILWISARWLWNVLKGKCAPTGHHLIHSLTCLLYSITHLCLLYSITHLCLLYSITHLCLLYSIIHLSIIFNHSPVSIVVNLLLYKWHFVIQNGWIYIMVKDFGQQISSSGNIVKFLEINLFIYFCLL